MNSNILYKYRDLDCEFTQSIFVDSAFWLSEPLEFNDPFDCGLSDSGEPKLDALLDYFKRKGASEKDMGSVVIAAQHDPNFLKNISRDTLRHTRESSGVLSLSRTPDNILMWSHYAKNHTGVVIGVDVSKIPVFLGRILPVEYESSYERIDVFGDHSFEKITKDRFGIKYTDWIYEEEVRVVGTPGLHKVDREAICEVYFGCRSSAENIEETISLCRGHGLEHVKFYKAATVDGEFKLKFSEIQ